MTLTVHVLQLQSRPDDLSGNMALLAAGAQRAAARQADLLVAPEFCLTGWLSGSRAQRITRQDTQDQLAALEQLARTHGLVVVAGVVERDGSRLYSSAALVQPGQSPLLYRRSTPYPDEVPGVLDLAAPATLRVACRGVQVGVLTGADLADPQHARRLVQAGSDLLAVPAALSDTAAGRFMARRVTPVRAFENGCHVALANPSGLADPVAWAGCSSIVSPQGAWLAQSDGPTVTDLSAALRPGAALAT